MSVDRTTLMAGLPIAMVDGAMTMVDHGLTMVEVATIIP
jgi:hypothetical protein